MKHRKNQIVHAVENSELEKIPTAEPGIETEIS